MPRTDYSTPLSPAAEALTHDIFALGKVGYVALGSVGEVAMRFAEGVATDTTAESNFYEELLVNPTLLRLAGQRGQLDCGGMTYIAIGYGGFIQLIMRMRDGHVSIGLGPNAHVADMARKAAALLEEHGLAHRDPQPWLLGVA
jgi:hypothetical protein